MSKFLLLLLLFIAYNSQAQPDKVQIKYVKLPSSTAAGTPDGKLVSKEIGPSGGKIISEDGKLELIFPEGALTANTTITIQPGTNLLPHGNGKAYQLGPSGTKFKKPVSLIFHYTQKEAETCAPEWMFLAIQDSKGKWNYYDYDDWDSTTRSLKGSITHFSAVVNGNMVEMYPREETLKVNGSMDFTLNIVTIPEANPGSASDDMDDLPPLPNIAPLGEYQPVWVVNGRTGGTPLHGRIIPKADPQQATYKAPTSLPLDYDVKVQLTVTLYVTTDQTIRLGKKGKMIKVRETKQLAKEKFTSLVHLYDEYEVQVDALVDNTRKGPFTQKWTDTTTFKLRVGKDPAISDIKNSLYHLVKENFTNNKCSFEYLNKATCKGPIHVTGIIGVGLSGNAGSSDVTALVQFVSTPWELPNLNIVCRQPLKMFPIPGIALPLKMKFQLKAGTYKEDFSDAAKFLPGGKITITLSQIKE